jgi:PAS domain S-box-containing protein
LPLLRVPIHARPRALWLAIILALPTILIGQERRIARAGIVQSFLNDARLVDRNLFQIAFDAQDQTIFVASSDGVHRYDGYRWSVTKDGLPSVFVRAVFVDSERRELWVGTDKGIAVLSLPDLEVRRTIRSELAGRNVRRIRRGANGAIWICSDRWIIGKDAPSGLTRYEPATDTWTRFTTKDGLPNDYVMDLFVDKNRTSWVLTDDGLARLRDDGQFDRKVKTPRESEDERRIWSMADSPLGGVVAATRRALYHRVGDEWRRTHRWAFDNPQLFLMKNGQLVMPRVRFQRMLFLDKQQLAEEWTRFQPEFTPFPFTPGVQRLEDIALAPDDSVWIVGRNLLLRWVPDGTTRESQWTSHASDYKAHFTVDQVCWMTTEEGFRRCNGGVREPYAPLNPNSEHPLEAKLPDGLMVFCVWRDPSTRKTWVGTNRGLFTHRHGEPRLDPVVSQPDRHIHGVVRLGEEIWFARRNDNSGQLLLCRLRNGATREFPIKVRQLLGKSSEGEVYFESEGGLCIVPGEGREPYLLMVPMTSTVTAVMRADDNALWLDVQTGWLRFLGDKKNPETTCNAPRRISEGDTLVVDVDVAEWMTPPDLARSYSVSTKLDDEPWTPFSILYDGKKSFTGLTAGDHVLRVRARDEGLDTDDEPAVVRFNVMGPGPALWPFFVGALALIAFGSFAGISMRRRHARLDSFRQLLGRTRAAMMSVDHNGAVINANDEARDLLGLTDAELGAQQLADMVEDLNDGVRLWQKLRQHGTIEELECRLVTHNGEVVTVVLSAVESTAGKGNVPGYRLLLQDVTEVRSIEHQLRQAQKMEGVGLLAGGVAHDFNNMLCGIMGYADLIRDQLDSENRDNELKEYAQNIIDTSRWAGELTDQLLAFSRHATRMEPVDLHHILAELHKLLLRTIDRRIEVEFETTARHSTVLGDPAQLHSAALNLAINARDAMPDGGKLRIQTSIENLRGDEPRLTGPKIEAGEFVCVRVIDTGVGIAPEDLPRIFEPFFTTKELGRGTGMGLAAVYGTTIAHHGTISVSSRLDHGTTIALFLPLVRDAAVAVAPPVETAHPTGHGTILLADDERVVRDYIQRVLRRAEFEVITVEDGIEAVEAYKSRGDAIDLVILDMMMPGMNGRDAMANILEADPAARILIVTGHIVDDPAQDVIGDGATGVLQKPFTKDELIAKVSAAISQPQS